MHVRPVMYAIGGFGLGFLISAALFIYFQVGLDYFLQAMFVGGIAAAVGGYFLGRNLDRRGVWKGQEPASGKGVVKAYTNPWTWLVTILVIVPGKYLESEYGSTMMFAYYGAVVIAGLLLHYTNIFKNRL